MGSALALGDARLLVIASYAIGALVALAMVFSLSEMAVVHLTAGSLGVHAKMCPNPWAGFVACYTYWIPTIFIAYFAWRPRSGSTSTAQ